MNVIWFDGMPLVSKVITEQDESYIKVYDYKESLIMMWAYIQILEGGDAII
jgi:hypothetical protein